MLVVVFLEKLDRRALMISRIITGIGLGTENGKTDKYGSQDKKQRYANNLFPMEFHGTPQNDINLTICFYGLLNTLTIIFKFVFHQKKHVRQAPQRGVCRQEKILKLPGPRSGAF